VKYFTPQLFVRLQECEDVAQYRAVSAKWERAAQQYQAHLDRLAPELKGGLRQLLRLGSLHDAQVVDVGTRGRQMTVVLRREDTPGLLSLAYSLVEAPWTDKAALPEEHRSAPLIWLYDEVARDPEMVYDAGQRIQARAADPPAKEEGWKPIFQHSILLSNGWEVRVRFHRLSVTWTTSLLGPEEPAQRDEGSLSRSA
jgi:hypothetical protein